MEASIDKLIKTLPTALDITLDSVQSLGLYYFPYSVGIEIECPMNEKEYSYQDLLTIFKQIPYIMVADVNPHDEQRFRIPNGIEGIICLFHISGNMKKYGLLNPLSGIHYHIDCTDWYTHITSEYIESQRDYILTELDTWRYKGTYNRRDVTFDTNHNWLRFQSCFKTAEFRLGEMTFEFELLFKRIAHASLIIRTIKNELMVPIAARYAENVKGVIADRVIRI